MTATLVEEPTPEPDPMAEAITALTTLARGRRTVGAGTPGEHTEPADFAEVACLVLTAVAANVGGVDELLAGRSGSWEADLVRQIVQGTAGSDPVDLMRHRTEPLHLTLDVESDVFADFGIEALYSADVAELDAREAAADEALFAAFSTPEERARIEQVRATIPNLSQELTPEESARADALMGEAEAIVAGVTARAEAEDDPLAAAADAAADAAVAVRELYQRDQDAYREAFTAAVRQALTDRGLTIAVDVIEPARADDDSWTPDEELTRELHEHARTVAVLPMTGQAPDFTQGTPGEALRAAGLTYIARVHAAG